MPGNRTYRPELWEACQKLAAISGATLSVTDDIDEGIRGVDAVYTDVWVGMGQPAICGAIALRCSSPTA